MTTQSRIKAATVQSSRLHRSIIKKPMALVSYSLDEMHRLQFDLGPSVNGVRIFRRHAPVWITDKPVD